MHGFMKNGTEEPVKKLGAIHSFAGESSLFLLIHEDVTSEHSTEKNNRSSGCPWQYFAANMLEKDPGKIKI